MAGGQHDRRRDEGTGAAPQVVAVFIKKTDDSDVRMLVVVGLPVEHGLGRAGSDHEQSDRGEQYEEFAHGSTSAIRLAVNLHAKHPQVDGLVMLDADVEPDISQ